MSVFKKAERSQKKLRMAIAGPPGSGKTYSALKIAKELGRRTVVIDSEHGSAVLYADEFDFDHAQLPTFDPRVYVDYIHIAEREGYDTIIIDSFSHAWDGKGGALEIKENISQRGGENSFTAWRHITPMHNALVDAILSANAHVIATMRAKMDHVIEVDGATGRNVVRKIGMGAIQRQGVEYEFDLTGDIDLQNKMVITKTRFRELTGRDFIRPGEEFAAILRGALTRGKPAEASSDYMLDVGRVARLGDLIVSAGFTPQQINASLSKRGVSRIESLTGAQADEMIRAIEGHLNSRVAAVAAPVPVVAPQVVPKAAPEAPQAAPEPALVDLSPASLGEAHAAFVAAGEAAKEAAPVLGPPADYTVETEAKRPVRNGKKTS